MLTKKTRPLAQQEDCFFLSLLVGARSHVFLLSKETCLLGKREDISFLFKKKAQALGSRIDDIESIRRCD